MNIEEGLERRRRRELDNAELVRDRAEEGEPTDVAVRDPAGGETTVAIRDPEEGDITVAV